MRVKTDFKQGHDAKQLLIKHLFDSLRYNSINKLKGMTLQGILKQNLCSILINK